MTNSPRVSLASLDHKVDELDSKVDVVTERLDSKIDESMAQTRMLFERSQSDIRQIAEGVGVLNTKMDRAIDRWERTEARVEKKGRDVDILKVSYGDLDRLLARLEEGP